jgi:ankyrin repeat protein
MTPVCAASHALVMSGALFAAARQNDIRTLQQVLLRERDDAVSAGRDDKGKTVLMAAAEAGAVATTVFLLLHGADCKATDRDGETAQASATGRSSLVTAAVLGAWAAEVARTDLVYRSTVPELIAANRQKLVDRLCERAVEGDAARIAGLLPRLAANGGAESYINGADSQGVTPLYAAARGNHVEAIDALVGAGCTLDSVDAEYGWTALMGAAANGAAEAVPSLVRHGADWALADRYENTALDIAREGKQKAVVKALLQIQRGGTASATVLLEPARLDIARSS